MEVAVVKKLTEYNKIFFSLPMLLSGICLGYFTFPEKCLFSFSWMGILPAFIFARISGMAFNQLIDNKIDALNPRTSKRAIPLKLATPLQVGLLAALSLLGFILSCAVINKSCFFLSLFIAFLLVFYSFTKRFTFCSHFILGLIHLFCPLMAAQAVTSSFCPLALLLGIGAFCLISGNDIIYSMQDLAFDKKHLLYSIPASFGPSKGIVSVFFLHFCTCLCLCLLGINMHSLALASILPLTAFGILLFLDLKCYQIIKKGSLLGAHFFWSNTITSFLILFFILSRLIL